MAAALAEDANSLLILMLRQAEQCDASASDEALAQRPEVEHHLDLWHALRHIGRAERTLEQVAYAAIGKEWGLRRKADLPIPL